jgi:hypothetical protein
MNVRRIQVSLRDTQKLFTLISLSRIVCQQRNVPESRRLVNGQIKCRRKDPQA